MVLADQVSDYTLRPQELRQMCLWDFVAKAEKAYGGKTGAPEASIEGDEEEVDGLFEDESVNNIGNTRIAGKRKKVVERYRFLPEHDECHRKHVRLREHDVVPVPIGPALPRRDQPEARARYCRLMLILFKPWRVLSDLRRAGESWEDAFNVLSSTMDAGHVRVVDNMQILHECRDSRNDHMQTRFRERSKNNLVYRSGERGSGNDVDEVDMSEVLEHLEDIDRMSSRRIDEANRDAQECLHELTNAGFFETSCRTPSVFDDAMGLESAVQDDCALEDEWKYTYEQRKAAWKLEARESERDVVAVTTTTINQIRDEATCVDELPVVAELGSAETGSDAGTGGDMLLGHIIERWTLNTEQKRAFEIVAKHTMAEKPEQLLMYLGGPGGTGKSRVVNALRDFFNSRKENRRFRLAAYTGVAARNIGGATLHALLQMNELGRNMSAKSRRDLGAMWEGIDYLFIDELSMIGCEMLYNISRALTEAKGTTAAFGGINIIFAGDFAQLPPIGDTRLYKDVNTTSVMAAATNRGQSKALGRLLWLSVEKVVILHETMRQSGSNNTGFVDLLQRLRDGVCNKRDYELLKGRGLRMMDIPNGDDGWKFAPVIVTSNATRDAINIRGAYAFAERTGAQLHWYHAIDLHKNAVVTDNDLIEKLEQQHSGQTKHRLRRIPLVVGMPVAINHNFDVAAGVVNGSHGFLRKLRYYTDNEGRRYLKSCIVEIPGSDNVEMPHLPPHHFPILPDTTELKFEHGASHKRCTIKRIQVPLEPGFSMTVHKAQGQTMERVIVDLASCAGTEPPYVMCSRATSLEGLFVLREFGNRQIAKRRSEELRKEFCRLMYLKWRTIVEYGSAGEVCEAKVRLNDLQRSATADNKRKADRDCGRGQRSKKVKLSGTG